MPALAPIRPERQQARRRLEEEDDPYAFRVTWERINREEREVRSASASTLTAGEVADTG